MIDDIEETSLLGGNGKKQATPIPWFWQFTIFLFLEFAEPLTTSVIYPFTPQLIRDIGVTHGNEAKVGHYVGLLESLFFLTRAFTVLYWSRTSDRIGRKPVILIGFFGLSISMFCFGVSKTFLGLVLSRSLNGTLNGNIGVMKSMMAEMTDSTNIARAYSYMPIAWSTASTLGPIIGGMLSEPAKRFPYLFGDNAFLKEYPYFLPCVIPAMFSFIAWLVAFWFLKETVVAPISINQLCRLTTKGKKLIRKNGIDLTTDESAATITRQDQNLDDDCPQAESPLPLRYLLTSRRVLIASGNYASLSLLEIAFRSILPVYLSTPIHLGGLGLSPPSIGKLLSIQGILNGFFQFFFFAHIHDRWGSKKTFIVGISSAIPTFILFPVANAFARSQGYSIAVWTAIGLQSITGVLALGGLSYGAIYIFISAASPNRASLGATYGLSVLLVNIMRAIGPAATNSFFSLSIENGYLGGYLVYYVLLVISGAALAFSSMLPRPLLPRQIRTD